MLRTFALLLTLFTFSHVQAAVTPLVEWTFDGTTTSTNGQHSGQATAVTYVAGHSGAATDQAVSFNGTNSQLRYSANSLWTFNQDQSFTVSFHIRSTQFPSPISTPVMCRPSSGGNPSWSFVMGGDFVGYDRQMGHLCFEMWNWSSDRAQTKRPINDGQWHHVVAAYYAPQRLAALFLDGELQDTMIVGGNYGGGNAVFNLGNNVGANQPFAGAIDQFTIASGVSDELLALLGFDAQLETIPKSTVEARYDQWLQRLIAIQPWTPTDLSDWEERRAAVRKQVLWGLGLDPFPYTQDAPGDLLPLDARYGTLVDYPDYTLQGIRIQTWENVYAYGFLYLPKSGSPPYPTILNPNGHFTYESRDPVIQSRCIGLARKGFIALSINSVHPGDERVNLMPQSGMTWNNMRALDYLLSRADVDPARIGSTGASGGSQQTFYLMAVDDRLAAAVPVVMPSYFKEIMTTRSGLHHFCNWVPYVMRLTDTPEMCATFAPKPALYISTSQDWTYRWPTQGMPEVRATYALYGATDAVSNIHDNLPHDYMRSRREQMYAFFLKEFMGITDPAAAVEPENLVTLTNAQMLALLPAAPTAEEINAKLPVEFAQRLRPADPTPADREEARQFQEALRERVRELIDAPIPESFTPSVSTAKQFTEGDVNVAVLHVRTEPEITVPVALMTRQESETPRPLVLLLGDLSKGYTYAQESALCQALLDRGCALALPDVRYTGELSSSTEWYRQYGTHVGRFEASVGAQDLLQILKVFREDEQFASNRTVVVGLGNAAIVGLLASALDDEVVGFAGSDVGASYGEGRTRPFFNGVVLLGDLPHLSLLMLGRPFLWRGVSDATKYAPTGHFAQILGAPLELAAGADAPGRAEILEWYDGLFQEPPPGLGKVLTIPDATAPQGGTFTLTASLTGVKSETHFGFSLGFDASRLSFLSVSSVGTLTQGWDQITHAQPVAGVARVEATAGQAPPADGNGPLIRLNFQVEEDAALGETEVVPDEASFSGGIEGATGVAGTVYVLAAPTPTPTLTPTPTPTPTPLPPAVFDLNQNGEVEAGDLLILIENFGTSDSACDFNGDGVVDEKDVLMFSLHWGIS